MTFKDDRYLRLEKFIMNQVDTLIDSSLESLSGIETILEEDGTDKETIKETMKLINDDLEQKRVFLKRHFMSRIDTITEDAIKNAIKEIKKDLK